MSSIKPKINIEKALRELNMEISRKFQVENPLTQISSNIPSSKDISRKTSKDITHIPPKTSKKNNKENCSDMQHQKTRPDPTDEQPIKNFTYVAISKALEEKTHLIGQQKHQIEVLRQCVEDVKHNKEVRISEENRVKSEELAALKAKEKEYMQGLAEILALKENFDDIKRKYNQMLAERNSLQQERSVLLSERNSLLNERNLLTNRCNNLFSESQELTIAIAHLKLEKEEREASMKGLEKEAATLREQLEERIAAEERSLGQQKRVNEFLGKLSDVQEQYSACQMKYFRLQQEYDTLRQQSEQRLASIIRQCRTERQEHEQEVSKLTASLRANEQKIVQQERVIIGLQEQRKRREENTEFARLAENLRQTEEINFQLHQEVRKWESYTKELTKQYQQEKEILNNQLISTKAEANSLKEQISTQKQEQNRLIEKISTLKEETSALKSTIHTFQCEVSSLTSKLQEVTMQRDQAGQTNLELANEREQTFARYAEILNEKEEEQQRNRLILVHTEEALSSLQQQMDLKRKQEEEILSKIDDLERRLTEENQHLQQKNTLLQQQIVTKTEEIQQAETERDSIRLESNSLKEELKIVRQQKQGEVRYYQQKYEKQLFEYNNLSQYSHSLELQNSELLKTNAAHIIQISNFKGQIAILHSDLSRLIASSSHPQISALKNDVAALKEQLTEFALESNQLRAECNKWQNQAANSQAEKNHLELQLRTAKWQEGTWRARLAEYQQRIEEKQAVIRQVRGELAQQMEQIKLLNLNITSIQHKYRNLMIEHQQQVTQWESFTQAAKEQQSQLHHSRLSAEYQLDNSQTTIAILKQENGELQRIFTEQLQRRNTIIRELMAEKRSLYGQLMGSRIQE